AFDWSGWPGGMHGAVEMCNNNGACRKRVTQGVLLITHIPITSRVFSKRLTELGINHVFEKYNSDHRNRLWGRQGRLYNEVLPWFSLLLKHSEKEQD
ncbi:MAG: hypothetical protein AAF438_08920, partial [Pseudomonadota bacterium]